MIFFASSGHGRLPADADRPGEDRPVDGQWTEGIEGDEPVDLRTGRRWTGWWTASRRRPGRGRSEPMGVPRRTLAGHLHLLGGRESGGDGRGRRPRGKGRPSAQGGASCAVRIVLRPVHEGTPVRPGAVGLPCGPPVSTVAAGGEFPVVSRSHVPKDGRFLKGTPVNSLSSMGCRERAARIRLNPRPRAPAGVRRRSRC